MYAVIIGNLSEGISEVITDFETIEEAYSFLDNDEGVVVKITSVEELDEDEDFWDDDLDEE